MSWGDASPVFLSWTVNRAASEQDEHKVELCRQLGEKLGLKDGEQVKSSFLSLSLYNSFFLFLFDGEVVI